MTKNNKTFHKTRSVPMRILSLCLFLWLAINLLALPIGAVEKSDESTEYSLSEAHITEANEEAVAERSRKLEYTLPGIPSRSLSHYKQLSLSVNGLSLGQPAVIANDITYLPFRAFFELLGAKVTYNSNTKTISAAMQGLYIYVTDGGYVAYANDRALFSFSPAILMNNGRMYVPASALIKAVGFSRDYQSGSAVSYSGRYAPLKHASLYYRSDEVLWLGKIISAESRGEPLIGQIAVGNVIMNRVQSNLYPDTIWGVIFDRRYGVQFSPVANGTVYQEPSYTSTLAAKICLEGTELSEDVLFFVAPKAAPNSWIARTREYAYTICNHDFYK